MKRRLSFILAIVMTLEVLLWGSIGTTLAAADAVQGQTTPKIVTTVPTNKAVDIGRQPVFLLNFDRLVSVADTVPSGQPVDSVIKIVEKADTKGENPIKISLDDLKKANPAPKDKISFQLPADKWLSYKATYEVDIEAGVFIDADNQSSEVYSYIFTTIPKLSVDQYVPQKDAVGVDPAQTLQLQFNEEIHMGSGTMQVKRTSDNKVIETLTLKQGQNHSQVNVSGKTVTFTLSKSLDRNTLYHVQMDSGLITTLDGKKFDGFSSAIQWSFKTQGDTAITSKSPQAGAAGVAANTKLQLSYNNPVYPGNGSIELYNSNGTKVTSVNVQSSQVTGGGSAVITIDPRVSLSNNTNYYVIVPNSIFQDREGNNVPGITTNSGWTFSTRVDNTSSLSISSFSPADRSTGVAVDADLYITFNKEVLRGTGSVTVRKTGSNVSVPVRVITDNPREVRIQLLSGYTYDKDSTYYVTIDPGAFYDKQNASNVFAGLTSSTGWTFQTYVSDKQPPVLRSSEMYNNSTIRLVYNEVLYSDSWPSTSNFNVTVNDEARRISYVYTSGDSVYVNLETGVAVGQNVKIGYSGGSTPIQDLARNAAAPFGLRDVVNGMDTALPKPTSGNVSGSTVTLYFNQSLKSPSAYAYEQFSVMADGTSIGVRNLSQSGSTLTLSLNSSVSDGQVVKISYKPGANPVQDNRGQNIAEFSDFIVRNYWDTKPPVFEKAEGGGTKLVLSFNELLSTSNVPMKSQFSVLVNDQPNYVNTVEIKDNQVTLTLATALTKDTKVTISYVPGTARLTDLNGNAAGIINLQPVNVTGYADMGDLKSAVVQGDTIQAVFAKALVSQSSLSVTQFQVLVDGVVRSITQASINSSTLTIKLSSPVMTGQKVELSYIPGATPLRDGSGSYLKYFNKIPVSNTNTTSGAGTVDPNRPAYLTLMEASEFGKAMFALGTQATAVSDVKSRNNQYIKQYRVDADKLKKSFEYMLSSSEKLHTVVVDAAIGLNSAYVSIPLDALEEIYNKDRSAAIAVRAGDAVYYMPLNQVSLPEIARSFNASSSSVTLNIVVEKLSSEAAADLSKKLNSGSSQKITEPIDFFVSAVNNSSPSNILELKLTGEYLIRSGSGVQDGKSGLVHYDTGADKLTFVPAVIESAGSRKVFHAKVKSNHTVMGATFYKYFSDLGNHWAKDDISNLAAKQIIEGRTNTTFAPDKNITRAEFAEYVARALGLDGDAKSAERFYDVLNTGSNAYIGAAAKAGIVTGNTDGSFKPGSSITREQMAIMMVRAMNYAGYNSTLTYPAATYLKVFKDSGKIQYPDSAAKVLKEGIIQGVSANTFQPKGNATRAQAAVMLKRLLEKIGYM